jgi:hypothetical protein
MTRAPRDYAGDAAPVVWVIWSPEHRGWWKGNRCGYVPADELHHAGRFSLEVATEIFCNSRYEDVPLPLTAAGALMLEVALQGRVP